MRTNPALFAVTTVLLFCAQSIAQSSPAGNPNVAGELEGKILYTRISDGGYRGEETWRMTVHPDGSRTMRMNVKLDDTQVARDVILRVDSLMRPIDSYQTLWTQGQHRGSGYYWVENDRMHALINGPGGRLEQSVPVPREFSFVSHPLGADGWHHWYYDFQRVGVQQVTVFNTDTLGLTIGSILGRAHEVDLEKLGEEKLTVQAGTFDTVVLLMDRRLKIWVDKPTLTMVRMTNESKDRHYELVQWHRQ